MRNAYRVLVILSVQAIAACGGVGATPDASMEDAPSRGPVGRTFRSNSEKFVMCARDSVSIQTGTPQTIKLKFVVGGDGSVQRSTIQSMSAPDPDLYSCVLKTLRKLKFPPPRDGEEKQVTHTLVLKPG